MPDVVIENPILNSPFEEPSRHFYFAESGITDRIVDARRISAYFVPIPPSKKKSGKEQLVLGTEWTKDRQQENKFINDIRLAVAKWRIGRYDGVTNTTRALLEYWQRLDRERKLFFCRRRAAEVCPRLRRHIRRAQVNSRSHRREEAGQRGEGFDGAQLMGAVD